MASTETKETSSLLREDATAQYLTVAVPTLRKWRTQGGGPVFLKLGRAVRYDVADLDAWLTARRCASTSSIIEVRP